MSLISKISELNRQHVRIKNPARLEEILSNMIEMGKEKLQVVSDFDRTISLCSYNGVRCPTSFGVIEGSNLISDDIKNQLNQLKNHYMPIEHNHEMTSEEKVPYMIEWWQKTFNLFIQTQITKEDVEQIVQKSMTHMRQGCKTYFQKLDEHDVPLLIFSAGIGDTIEAWIKHECGWFNNMKIVSNFMKFDEKTKKLVGFQGKMIHVFNKNEGAIHHTEYEKKIESRSNAILLGDSLGDAGMAQGMPNLSNVLKIGFLNDKVEEFLPTYMDAFDIVTIEDDTFDIPNSILTKIINSK